MKHITLSAILCVTFGLGASMTATAGDAPELRAEGNFSCGTSKQVQKGRFRKQVFERQIRKQALAAAKRALDTGYNFGVMEPYQFRDQTYIGTSTNVYGRQRQYEYTNDYEVQPCTAVDDVTAFDYYFGDTQKLGADDNAAFVSFRDVIAAYGSDSDKARYGALSSARPNISEDRYENPGDKERIARLYPVQMKAASCLPKWRPAGPRNFAFQPSASDIASRDACLSQLKSEASAVGWSGLQAGVDSAPNTTGYSVNPREPKLSKSADGQVYGQAAEQAKWGEGWTDISGDFPGYNGIILVRPNHSHTPHTDLTIVFGTNSADDTQIMESGLYHMARLNLADGYPGITLLDQTQDEKDRFQSRKEEFLRKSARENKRSSSVTEEGRLKRKIEDLQDDLEDMPRRRAKILQSKEQVMVYAKSFPDQMKEAEASFELMLTQHDEKEASMRSELGVKQAELSTLSTTPDGAVNAQITERLSASRTGKDRGIFRAIEDYSTVRIFRGRGNLSRCYANEMVCADKVAAYNAIGPKLGANGFFVISSPPGYKPFDTTPRD